MDGLKYILNEIEVRRGLLHEFQRAMDIENSMEFHWAPALSRAFSMAPELLNGEKINETQRRLLGLYSIIKEEEEKEFTLFKDGVPTFVKDGLLAYRATHDAEPILYLTVNSFNTQYKSLFNDLSQYSAVGIPLKPQGIPPSNYRIFEMLEYHLGEGFCSASLHVHIWFPSIQNPERQFYVLIEDRYVPKQRTSPKDEEGNTITPQTYPYQWVEQDVDDFAKIVNKMLGASIYNSWKKDRRKTKTQDLPAEILINEGTTSDQIWGQLLLSAYGHSYFDSEGQVQAYNELKRYFSPQILDRILIHLQGHTFNPHDIKSNMAYIKNLRRNFQKIDTHEESGDFINKDTETLDDNLNEVILRGYPKSVLWTSSETGIPVRTIYQLIRDGKIQTDNSNSDIITLTDEAIEKLKKLSEKRVKRDAIYELAEQKGKSDKATKKWLQRHRDLPEDEFNKALRKWLKLDGIE